MPLQVVPPDYRRARARLVRRTGGGLVLVVFSSVLMAGQPVAAGSAGPVHGEPDRRRLAAAGTAGTAGAPTVEVLLATERGQTVPVAAVIGARGGTVRYRHDGLGYLRAEVPADQVAALRLQPGVVAADLGEVIARVAPADVNATPAGVNAAPTGALAGPSRSTPAANDFLPIAETGSVGFQAVAGRDGRGVTIGVLDSGIDLGHPALQTTSTGQRKIIGSFSATDPLFDGDLTWFDLSAATRQVRGPGLVTLSAGGLSRSYRLPSGTFRARIRLEAQFKAPYDGDLNRDGDSTDLLAVLWDEAAGTVRVDRDFDFDFTDETPLRDFSVAQQSATLGTDRTSTPIREAVPFSVQIDRAAKAVNLGLVTDSHGTHVAGILAGRGLYGGAAHGQAPGARLVSVQVCLIGGGCPAHALIEGMIHAVVTARVDVVNMSIGGLPALNDGNNVRAQVYHRLIREYGVQIVLSAGNSGPGVNTVSDPSVVTEVLSVAAGISRATWRANYGVEVAAEQSLFSFSARGPREDGALKPTLSAPGSAISAIPSWARWQPVDGPRLPPGYALLHGTSMAAPQVTGAAALLLGAARAQRQVVTPVALRAALTSSAIFNPDYGAHAQGFGRLDVPQAFALLTAMLAQPSEPASFTVSAPVCTSLAAALATPGRGAGLYNRCPAGAGGHLVGQTRSYPVTVARSTAGSAVYDLRWRGNDGTFGAPAQVTLAAGRPVAVPVTAAVRTAGTHSGLLLFDDPQTPQTDLAVLATVLSAPPPTARTTLTGAVARSQTRSLLVTVAPGMAALQVTLSSVLAGSQVRFIAHTPLGVPVEDTSSANCFTARPVGARCTPGSRSYPAPMAGIWEFVVEARRTTPQPVNPFTLTVRTGR